MELFGMTKEEYREFCLENIEVLINHQAKNLQNGQLTLYNQKQKSIDHLFGQLEQLENT